MRIYHARRKGQVIELGPFQVKPVVRPARFFPIGAPAPIIRDPVRDRFEQFQPLVFSEASHAIRKMSPLYDLKTLVHFGLIGLWDACKRFTGDEATFPYYARVRIRGQIWDEIRGESHLPRRLLKSDDKPRLTDIDDVVLASPLPMPDDIIHLRDIIRQVESCPFSERERQVIETLAAGDPLGELALSWGTSVTRASQVRTRAVTKMTALVRKADLE
jgi:RNA polymerase sigma factor (sigma-70 family)